MFSLKRLFKKPAPLLTVEDMNELKKLERESYMKEARNLIILRGIDKAKKEIGIKPKEPQY